MMAAGTHGSYVFVCTSATILQHFSLTLVLCAICSAIVDYKYVHFKFPFQEIATICLINKYIGKKWNNIN